MIWERMHTYCWKNAEGYRVAAFRFAGGFRYGAFGPKIEYDIFKDRCKVRYRRGERVTQQSEHLGCFDDPESARAACVAHQTNGI